MPRLIKKYFFTQQQDHNKLETGVLALMVVRYWRKITVAVFIRQKPPVCALTAVMVQRKLFRAGTGSAEPKQPCAS